MPRCVLWIGRLATNQVTRACEGRLVVHFRRCGIQPDPPAQAASRSGMSVAGKWRIVEMPGFPQNYPDLVEPAYILFENGGGGEFAFGACPGISGKPAAPKRQSSTSRGTAATRWTRFAATETPSSSLTARSTAKFATATVMNSPSSLQNALLQRPARGRWCQKSFLPGHLSD